MIESKIKEAYGCHACATCAGILSNAYVQAEARARMLEFSATAFEYYDHEDNFISSRPIDVTDPRHNWTLADWVAEVKAELKEP